MSLHPAPVVMDNGNPRFPNDKELAMRNSGGRWKGDWGYRISRVTNSVDYSPDMPMCKDEIVKLIEAGWTVTVLSDVK